MAADDEITVKMTRTEALALMKVANIGMRVVKALDLIKSTSAAEHAIRLIDAVATRA